MTSRVDEEKAAMDTRILDVTIANRGKLFPEIRAVLVLDVLDDRVPAKWRYEKAIIQSLEMWRKYTYQFSLLTMSPYPGVSTMFNRRRTPFSVITIE